MKIPLHLNWNLSPEQAISRQAQLAAQVRTDDDFGVVTRVAGVDVGFEQDNTIARAAVVVLDFPSLEPLASAIGRQPVTFPYIPGLLAYRELPAVFAALEQLQVEPDLMIVDGQGLAHPRRFGIACHLGVLLDKPSIGCAKSILVGKAETPENRIGAWTPLVHKNETIGAAVRTKLNTKRPVNPVYVSIGHRISLESAIDFVLRCCRGYRVPETTRYAHLTAGGKEFPVRPPQQKLL
jgi:deoxyribonuclease V